VWLSGVKLFDMILYREFSGAQKPHGFLTKPSAKLDLADGELD
jgi:hypothetical protein